MSFPSSPIDGQLYTTALGTEYKFYATDGAWKIAGGPGEGDISGTPPYMPKFLTEVTIGNSQMWDDDTRVGIGDYASTDVAGLSDYRFNVRSAEDQPIAATFGQRYVKSGDTTRFWNEVLIGTTIEDHNGGTVVGYKDRDGDAEHLSYMHNSGMPLGSGITITKGDYAKTAWVGIDTSRPSEALTVAGNISIGDPDLSDATTYYIKMPKCDSSDANGHTLTITAGDATSGGTCATGGNLNLEAGTSIGGSAHGVINIGGIAYNVNINSPLDVNAYTNLGAVTIDQTCVIRQTLAWTDRPTVSDVEVGGTYIDSSGFLKVRLS